MKTQGDASLHSAIFRGRLQHRRHAPHAHRFDYPLFMMYLDLDELPRLFTRRWFWSVGRRNLAEFRRSDYLGDPDRDLADCVRDCVSAKLGWRPDGPIRLLTHLRYFGHCFNPVSFYYCFAEDGETLRAIVAEITNTPWQERHQYVLDVHGAERTILTGARRFMEQCDFVVFETYNFGPATRRFGQMAVYFEEEFGLRCIDMAEPKWRPYDNALWQLDLYFVRPEGTRLAEWRLT